MEADLSAPDVPSCSHFVSRHSLPVCITATLAKACRAVDEIVKLLPALAFGVRYDRDVPARLAATRQPAAPSGRIAGGSRLRCWRLFCQMFPGHPPAGGPPEPTSGALATTWQCLHLMRSEIRTKGERESQCSNVCPAGAIPRVPNAVNY